MIVSAAYAKHPVRRFIEQHLVFIRSLIVFMPICIGALCYSNGLNFQAHDLRELIGIPLLTLASILPPWVFLNEIRDVDADDHTLLAIANDSVITQEFKSFCAQRLSICDGIHLWTLRHYAWDSERELVRSLVKTPGRDALIQFREPPNELAKPVGSFFQVAVNGLKD